MLFLYEVKKICKQRLFQLAILSAFLLCIGLFAYEVYGNGRYTEEGIYERGISSSQALVKKRQELNKGMNDELLQEVYTVYQTVFKQPSNFDAYGELKPNVIGQMWQSYQPLGDLLLRCSSITQTYDINSLSFLKKEDIGMDWIWRSRTAQLASFMNMQGKDHQPLFHEKEKKRIMGISAKSTDSTKIQTYEDASGWTILMKDLVILNIAILVLSTIIGSSLFSKEHHYGMSSILYTSKHGRTKDVWMKLTACFMVITFCTIILHFLYAVMIFAVFSTSGMTTLIQYQPTYWLSIFSLTNLQAYLFLVGLGYGGSLVMLMVSLYISRYTKKENYAMILSLLFLFLPMIITMPMQVFPTDMCNGNLQLLTLSIQMIGSLPLFLYEQQMLFCFAEIFSLLPLVHSFTKRYPKLL